jgi:hypothetical protein
MLAHEWRELEMVCARLSDLRHRYDAAQKTQNVGLVEGLKDDIARVTRQRELLVHHLSAALGALAAEGSEPTRRVAGFDPPGNG